MHLKLLTLLLLIVNFSIAQTSGIGGKILDASNNQPLAGATVTLKGLSNKTLSDVDGAFKIRNVKRGTYVLAISYVGYASKEISDVVVDSNEVTNVFVTLTSAQNTTLQDVVVKTDARKESIASILNTRKNASVVSDAISAEMIRRSPDRSVGDVLKRLSGTTIQDNKFVVVRGMADRYNEAMLNGTILPSTEADRKTFAFDIFPSEIVDNITVIKSASAEYPGSFAGGLVIVNLKDVPDKNFFAIKTGLGYNTISTGKTLYEQKAGSYDFIGVDDGKRSLPGGLPDTKQYNRSSPADKTHWARKFRNDWGINKDRSTPFNTAFQMSGGFTSQSKKKYLRFGGVFGLSYSSNYRISKLTNSDYGQITILPDSIAKATTYYEYKDTSYTRNILSSALANFTLKINPNNKFFFNNLYSINSFIQTYTRGGLSEAGTGTLAPYYAYFHSFQSNQIYNGQLGGEHFLSKYKIRFKWVAYYTNFYRDEPDYRQMVYFKPNENAPYFAYVGYPTLSNTTLAGLRMYYTTRDISKGLNFDFIKPFQFLNNAQTLKFGFGTFWDSRTRDGRYLRNDQTDAGVIDQSLLFKAPNVIFKSDNFRSNNGFVLTDFAEKQWYYYTGSQKNIVAYTMLDNKFTDKLRLSWGLRVENYSNILKSYQEGSKKYKVDTSFLDFLPSANFIYSVLPKSNLRLSYSRCVARPLYRELAATQFYDFVQNAVFYGGFLAETKIDNYELRWEQYFNNAQYYSVSGFYKKFKNAIEQKIVISGADSRTITWANVPNAEVEGIEIEGRKNLSFITEALSNFYLYANAAAIKSTAFVAGNGSDTSNRPFAGQSPYVINASIQYSEPKSGINVSALYNSLGARIFLVGNNQNPYLWEKPHSTLDFKISKTFWKNGLVELSMADILHKDDIYFWDENGNKRYDANYPDVRIQSRSFGTTITLSVGYKF